MPNDNLRRSPPHFSERQEGLGKGQYAPQFAREPSEQSSSRRSGASYGASKARPYPRGANKHHRYKEYGEDGGRQHRYSSRSSMTPEDTPENEDSAYGGMYSKSDSKYRWRKVRGNLDLFVMERNERHLTSLHWKWQKLPQARKRSPGYDMYYEEQMKLVEERKKNEETIAALHDEQSKMETELSTLRGNLAELHPSNNPLSESPAIEKKIDGIQKQIAKLNEKLTDNDDQLKNREAQRQSIETRQTVTTTGSSKYGSDDTPHSPLFIIGDPKNGTAAAVAPGRHSSTDFLPDPHVEISDDSVFYEPHAHDVIEPSRFYIPQQQIERAEEQARKEMELQNDLQIQMDSLKAQLEEQLQSSAEHMKEENGKIIDEKVANLEKQIFDMDRKIKVSDSIMHKALNDKKKKEDLLQKEREAWQQRMEQDRKVREKSNMKTGEESVGKEREYSAPKAREGLGKAKEQDKKNAPEVGAEEAREESTRKSREANSRKLSTEIEHSRSPNRQNTEDRARSPIYTKEEYETTASFCREKKRKTSPSDRDDMRGDSNLSGDLKQTIRSESEVGRAEKPVSEISASSQRQVYGSTKLSPKNLASSLDKESPPSVSSKSRKASDHTPGTTPRIASKLSGSYVSGDVFNAGSLSSNRRNLNSLSNSNEARSSRGSRKAAEGIALDRFFPPTRSQKVFPSDRDSSHSSINSDSAPNSRWGSLKSKMPWTKPMQQKHLASHSSDNREGSVPSLSRSRETVDDDVDIPEIADSEELDEIVAEEPREKKEDGPKKPTFWDRLTKKARPAASTPSDVSDASEGFNAIQTRDLDEDGSDGKPSCNAEEGWNESRCESKKSLLEGLGTSYCVVPSFIWKHLGNEHDDEPITRKKCVAFILGVILIVLLIAIVLGLIIGLVSTGSEPETSPIRFVVIPGNPEEGADEAANVNDAE